ncbi:MAG: hypothetical protein R3F37_17055 [Candidatus Competibacteraceae bacterium]
MLDIARAALHRLEDASGIGFDQSRYLMAGAQAEWPEVALCVSLSSKLLAGAGRAWLVDAFRRSVACSLL